MKSIKKKKRNFVYGGGAIDTNKHFSVCHVFASMGINDSINCHGYYKNNKPSGLGFLNRESAFLSENSRENLISSSNSGNKTIKNEIVPEIKDFSSKKEMPRSESLGVRTFESEHKTPSFTAQNKVDPIVESRSSELPHNPLTVTPRVEALVNEGRAELLNSMLKRHAKNPPLANRLFVVESTTLEAPLPEGRVEGTLIVEERLNLIVPEDVIGNAPPPPPIVDKANATEIKLFKTKSATRMGKFVGTEDERMGLRRSVDSNAHIDGLKRSMAKQAKLENPQSTSYITKNSNDQFQSKNFNETDFGMEKAKGLITANVVEDYFEHTLFTDDELGSISARYFPL